MLLVAAILATLDDPFYDPPEHLVKYETPQQRRSYTAWATKLRNDLLEDYDQVVPPRSDGRSAGDGGCQTSVDRLSTLAENSVEGSNPGEVAVEVRGDSGGTLKVSSAI